MKNACSKLKNDARISVEIEYLIDYYCGHDIDISEDDEHFILTTTGEVTSFGRRDEMAQVRIIAPKEFLPSPTPNAPLMPFEEVLGLDGHFGLRPYGKKMTERLAAHMLGRRWERHEFGMVPGTFAWDDMKRLNFSIQLNPGQHFDSLLFYADTTLKGFAGPAGLASFQIGECNLLYGCIVPVSYISQHILKGYQHQYIIERIRDGVAEYLCTI